MKKLKYLVIILIAVTLFLTISTQRDNLTDLHRDGWIVITTTQDILDSGHITFTNPYTDGSFIYPPGSWIMSAVLSTNTGLDLTRIAQIFPAINFVLLGLMIFLVARHLFKDDWIAIACMAFTPLIFNNVTIMGHYYFIPLAFGVTLSLLFFNFYLKEKWFMAIFTFLVLSVTHSSTIIFTSIAAGIYLIFNKKYWKKIPLFALLAIILFAALKFTKGVDVTEKTVNFVEYILTLSKQPPFISVYLTLSIIFLIFLAFGFLFVVLREKKARLFLVPIFFFLVFDLFMYWNYQGFFIVYRRLIYYLLLFIPFFVGYGVYSFSYLFTHLFSHTHKTFYNFIKNNSIILIFMLLLLVPAAVSIHIGSHPTYTLVNQKEQELFTEFGKLHPGAYLATNHLQSFGLPYYDLKPVHIPFKGGWTHLPELAPCFAKRDIDCLIGFYNHTNYTYLYTQSLVNSTYFEPAFEYDGMVIYEFVRNETKNTSSP